MRNNVLNMMKKWFTNNYRREAPQGFAYGGGMMGFVIACVKLLSADTRRFGGAITRDNAMTMTVRQIHSQFAICRFSIYLFLARTTSEGRD